MKIRCINNLSLGDFERFVNSLNDSFQEDLIIYITGICENFSEGFKLFHFIETYRGKITLVYPGEAEGMLAFCGLSVKAEKVFYPNTCLSIEEPHTNICTSKNPIVLTNNMNNICVNENISKYFESELINIFNKEDYEKYKSGEKIYLFYDDLQNLCKEGRI